MNGKTFDRSVKAKGSDKRVITQAGTTLAHLRTPKRFPVSAHWLLVKEQKEGATERQKDQPVGGNLHLRRNQKTVRKKKTQKEEGDKAAVVVKLTVQPFIRTLHLQQKMVIQVSAADTYIRSFRGKTQKGQTFTSIKNENNPGKIFKRKRGRQAV